MKTMTDATVHAALSLCLPYWPRRETTREALYGAWGTYQAAQCASQRACDDHAATAEILSEMQVACQSGGVAVG